MKDEGGFKRVRVQTDGGGGDDGGLDLEFLNNLPGGEVSFLQAAIDKAAAARSRAALQESKPKDRCVC